MGMYSTPYFGDNFKNMRLLIRFVMCETCNLKHTSYGCIESSTNTTFDYLWNNQNLGAFVNGKFSIMSKKTTSQKKRVNIEKTTEYLTTFMKFTKEMTYENQLYKTTNFSVHLKNTGNDNNWYFYYKLPFDQHSTKYHTTNTNSTGYQQQAKSKF